MDEFDYVDESSIYDALKCDICKKPFIDPILLPCKETFCKKCIEDNLNIHTKNCSQCDTNTLQLSNLDVGNPIIEKMLNKQVVQCRRCSQNDIQRKDWIKHCKEICPKRIVICSANDLECSWQESYDQLNEHLAQCPYEKLRTLLTNLFKDRQDLQELNKQSAEQKTYIDQIENQNKTFKNEIDVLKANNQTLTDEIKTLKTDNQTLNQQIEDFDKLKNEYNQLIEQSKKQSEQIELLTNEKADLLKDTQQQIDELKTENTRLNQVDTENQQLKDNLIEFDSLRDVNQKFQELNEYINTLQDHYQQLHISFNNLQNEYDVQTLELEQLNMTRENEMVIFEELKKQNDLFQKEIYDLQTIEKSYFDLRKKSHDNEIRLEQLAIELKRFQTAECPPEINEKIFQSEEKYENNRLKQILNNCQIDSLINLNREKLNENDMNMVIQTGLITKLCHSLILSSNQLSLNSIRILSEYLNFNQTLRKLILTDNQLSDSGVQCLADCLAFNNQTLEVLNLSSNQLSDQCLIYLSNMLKSNQTIRSIGLHENQLTDQSIEYLSKVMQNFNSTLEEISLYSNEFITDASIQSIYDMIKKNQSLKILWIWNCQLSQEGKQQIQQAIEEDPSFDLQI